MTTVGITAALAVYPGFLINDRVSEPLLKWTILGGLLVAGIKLLVKPATIPGETETAVTYSRAKEIAIGVGFGLAMGILGGGGGIFIAVALIFAFRLSAKQAVGSSIVIMTLAAIPGCLLHGLQQNIQWPIAAIIIPTSFAVAFVAARLGRKTPEAYVKRGLGVYLVAIFFIMLIKELF